MKYKNYHLMRKNCNIKLQKSRSRCKKCNKYKNVLYTHHKDFSKNNNYLKNLIAICQSCHMLLHIKNGDRKYISKFKNIYGISKKEIIKQYNISTSKIYNLHKINKLQDYLKNPSLNYTTSKFKRLYGLSCQEMANKFGGTRQKYSLMHKNNKIETFLKKYLTK